jgi:hypothetical protein
MTETDIRKKIREEHEQEIESNDRIPFGFINSGSDSAEVDSEGVLWFSDENDFSYYWKYNF